MMKQTKNIIAAVRKQGASVLLLACVPLAFASCIDEDLSECGVDYAIDYRLELSTSLRLSLDQELVTPAEQQLAEALKSALSDIITDKAKVVDLSFFTFGNGKLTKHQTFNPDANSLSLTVYMDRGDYHNIALAATQQEDEVRIDGASTFFGINLRQVEADLKHKNQLDTQIPQQEQRLGELEQAIAAAREQLAGENSRREELEGQIHALEGQLRYPQAEQARQAQRTLKEELQRLEEAQTEAQKRANAAQLALTGAEEAVTARDRVDRKKAMVSISKPVRPSPRRIRQ